LPGPGSTAHDLANSINYLTGVTTGITCVGEDSFGACYAPNGALATMVNGYTPGFQGITTTDSYNKRFQPAILSASAPGQTVFSLSYDFHLGTGDNGNVYGITNGRDSFRALVGSATYTFDSMNRLQSAATTGTDCTLVNGFTKNWGESFTLDAWGNLLSITPTKCSAENLQVSVTPPSGPSKNQITTTGYAYDAAGNMTQDGQGHFPVYDAENRIKTVAGVNYTYDGDGRRVKKDSGKLYWTGSGSDPLAESDLSGTINEEYVFFNSKRIARVDLPSGTVHYYFSDHLGSASVVTNATGTTIEQESDYYPYGGERVLSAGANNYKFSGKERDSESALDDFGARFYSSQLGRFMTGDWSAIPVPVPYATFENPQSLNLYTYRTPVNAADVDGHLQPGDQPLPDVKHVQGAAPEPNSVKGKGQAADKAAVAALKAAYAKKDALKKEYGGVGYSKKDGTIATTDPKHIRIQGQKDSETTAIRPSDRPKDTTLEFTYHSHSDATPRSNEFSSEDLTNAWILSSSENRSIPSYVGDANGGVYRYTPDISPSSTGSPSSDAEGRALGQIVTVVPPQ
jgi:RHS repeat-associated protein